jgi:hypothetical protein
LTQMHAAPSTMSFYKPVAIQAIVVARRLNVR